MNNNMPEHRHEHEHEEENSWKKDQLEIFRENPEIAPSEFCGYQEWVNNPDVPPLDWQFPSVMYIKGSLF